MRKYLYVFLAILLVAGVAHAISIPQSEDPKTGPAVWTVPVYNNSGGTLDVGDVVVWDIASSTGDDDNYVTTTTTADTFLVAGVVYGNDILAASRGVIAVHGVVSVDLVTTSHVNAGTLLCSGTTAGAAQACSDLTSDNEAIGFSVTEAGTGASTGQVFLFRNQ